MATAVAEGDGIVVAESLVAVARLEQQRAALSQCRTTDRRAKPENSTQQPTSPG